MFKEMPLLMDSAKILHILDADDDNVLGYGERFVIGNEHETAFWRQDGEFLSIQPGRNGLIAIDQKSTESTVLAKLAVASHKHS